MPPFSGVCSFQYIFPINNILFPCSIPKLFAIKLESLPKSDLNFHVFGPQILQVRGLQISGPVSQITLTS